MKLQGITDYITESAKADKIAKYRTMVQHAVLKLADAKKSGDKDKMEIAKDRLENAKSSLKTAMVNEAQSGDKAAYKKFFDATLKKYKANSPSELSDEDKKKFYDEIDRGWEAADKEADANESSCADDEKVDENKLLKNKPFIK